MTTREKKERLFAILMDGAIEDLADEGRRPSAEEIRELVATLRAGQGRCIDTSVVPSGLRATSGKQRQPAPPTDFLADLLFGAPRSTGRLGVLHCASSDAPPAFRYHEYVDVSTTHPHLPCSAFAVATHEHEDGRWLLLGLKDVPTGVTLEALRVRVRDREGTWWMDRLDDTSSRALLLVDDLIEGWSWFRAPLVGAEQAPLGLEGAASMDIEIVPWHIARDEAADAAAAASAIGALMDGDAAGFLGDLPEACQDSSVRMALRFYLAWVARHRPGLLRGILSRLQRFDWIDERLRKQMRVMGGEVQ